MLAIRMQRNGRVHAPVYRIVVQEAQRHPLSGRVVAEVGNYNPETKKGGSRQRKVEFYLKNGAQPSSRVAFVFKKRESNFQTGIKKLQQSMPKLSTPISFARTNLRKSLQLRKLPNSRPLEAKRPIAGLFVVL